MLSTSARVAAGALTLAAVAALSACGGGSGDRPSADELASTLKGDSSFGQISDKVVDCMAKAYVDSDVSDGFLRAMVKKDEDYKPSKKDTEEAMSVATDAAKDCVGSDLPSDLSTESTQ